MSLEAARYKEIVCTVCGQSFESLEEFKEHADKSGRRCIGGTPR